jgi:hypothetical protein
MKRREQPEILPISHERKQISLHSVRNPLPEKKRKNLDVERRSLNRSNDFRIAEEVVKLRSLAIFHESTEVSEECFISRSGNDGVWFRKLPERSHRMERWFRLYARRQSLCTGESCGTSRHLPQE